MSCALYRAIAGERLDRTLTAAEEDALDSHLAGCRPCAVFADEMAALPGLLRETACAEPPADLAGQVFSCIETDRAGLAGRALRLLFGILPRRGLVPSTAVSLALLLAGVGLTGTRARDAGFNHPPGREASLLTVWDSSAETIVATFDPTGIARPDACHDPGRVAPATGGVRIFLFERIVVRG